MIHGVEAGSRVLERRLRWLEPAFQCPRRLLRQDVFSCRSGAERSQQDFRTAFHLPASDDFRTSVTQELPRWFSLSPSAVALKTDANHGVFRSGSFFRAVTSGGVRHVYSWRFVSSQVGIHREYQREGRKWEVGKEEHKEEQKTIFL